MAELHPIVQILIDDFNANKEALSSNLEHFEDPRLPAMALKKLVVRYKVSNDESFQQAVAKFYDLEYQNDFESITELQPYAEAIPIRYAKKFMFFPVRKHEFELEVAVEDPENFQPIDDVGRIFKCRVVPIVSNQQAILGLINRAYERTSSSTEDAVDSLNTNENFENILGIDEPEDLIDTTDEEPVKRLVNNILWQAAREEASDIHIDPTPKESGVRYRIDGVLHSVSNIPKTAHITVINRIKVMSRLDIAQKGMPQDGRTMVLIAGKKIDIRVSTIPTIHGEKVVMRLLYQSNKLMQLNELGLSKNIYEGFEKSIHKTGGIILVTGPTGSGKTTTLYAALGCLDHISRNIITIEDPVEYKITGYAQIEINHKLGLSFAVALRSVLRQDPDIIMVGEMRDIETAQIAIQSALTGHLVFSTVHTNSAPATITRLIDMRVQPFLVSSSIIAILAQRLVRKICSNCKESYVPHEEQLREIGISAAILKAHGGKLHRGKGCNSCRGTGYKGRMGIHEFLTMSDKIKNIILETSDSNVIKKVALQNGMISLRMDGAQKVLEGSTTVEEILSITSEDSALI